MLETQVTRAEDREIAPDIPAGLELGLRNYWYPILQTEDLPAERPIQLTALGEDIAVWRDAAGPIANFPVMSSVRNRKAATGMLFGIEWGTNSDSAALLAREMIVAAGGFSRADLQRNPKLVELIRRAPVARIPQTFPPKLACLVYLRRAENHRPMAWEHQLVPAGMLGKGKNPIRLHAGSAYIYLADVHEWAEVQRADLIRNGGWRAKGAE